MYFRIDYKKVIISALLPFLLIVGWYGKNLYLFGNFGASSWMGMGLYKVTTFLLEDKDRQDLYQDGIISKYSLTMPFAIDLSKVEIPNFKNKTGYIHESLGMTYKKNGNKNYNYYGYLTVSEKMMGDFKSILRNRPSLYLKGILGTSIIYFTPASSYLESMPNVAYNNYEIIRPIDRLYGIIYYGSPYKYGGEKLLGYLSDQFNIPRSIAWRLSSVGVFIIITFTISTIYWLLFLFKQAKKKRLFRDKDNLLILFLLFNIVYVTAVGILCEAGENQRHRFMIEPFVLVLFLSFISNNYKNRKKI